MNRLSEYSIAVDKLRSYIKQHKLKSVVIGISGGIDSCVTVAIARQACKNINCTVIGAWIGIESKREEYERAQETGRLFCDTFLEYHLSDVYDGVKGGIDQELDTKESEIDAKIRLGNIKARLRMITLYDIAQSQHGMVLSTDNYTEYLLGFWTLHGDVGDFGPIQNLWKTEVYGLAEYISKNLFLDTDTNAQRSKIIQKTINAIPTDGLGITESDLDQIGCETYAEVDDILKYVEDTPKDALPGFILKNPVVKRYYQSEFKRKLPISVNFN